jgi:phage repressor protein C with HTH and peptisase S24 domain
VRETKGTDDIEKLQWESEGWKIRFGEAHYDAIDVDYAFGEDPVALIEPQGATVTAFPAPVVQDDPSEEERFSTHLPVYSLEAAAGHFGEGHDVDIEGWGDVSSVQGRVNDSMFVSQVVGRSMEPRIPDGSYCIFQRIGAGTRQGKTVLAQHRDIADPDTGGAYTVKRYHSEKRTDGEEVGGRIELQPLSADFEPIVLEHDADDEVLVIGEIIAVLGSTEA